MSTDVLEVKCIECGADVVLIQPPDHSEFVPSGYCPKCRCFHYVSYNSAGEMQINASRKMIEIQ